MTLQFSVAVQNGRLDAIETVIGASAKLNIYSGSVPANCAAAPAGTLLASITLPADYMAPASGGTKTMSGTWTGTAVADGTAGYFRITDSGGTVCGEQGTISAAGGGGDMIVQNTSFKTGQNFSVTTHTLMDANG